MSGAEYPVLVPDADHVRHARHQWEWFDMSDGDLRCLWVLERFLGEQGRRFYHLPKWPLPKRVGGTMSFPVHIFGSFDGAGLGALTVAAFGARVRVEVSTAATWTTMTPERDDVERVDWASDVDHGMMEDEDFTFLSRMLAVTLSPREPSGHLFERHPGATYLHSLETQFFAPITDGD